MKQYKTHSSQNISSTFLRSTAILILVLVSGCTSVGSYQSRMTYAKPMFGDIARSSIAYEGVERNPVIVIPGLFGSRLIDVENGEVMWGEFGAKDAVTRLSRKRMNRLAHPMGLKQSLRELNDSIAGTLALAKVDVNLLMVPLQIDAYNDLLEALSFGGYYSRFFENRYNKHYNTCFQFGYDWRRDIVENAQKLHDFILVKKAYLQKEYEKVHGVANYDVQFDIVAHSMGGLVARYYMMYGDQDLPNTGDMPKVTWAGASNVDKVIIIGAPNAGYLDSLLELQDGVTFVPGLSTVPATVLGTFPSVYEMLPYEHMKSIRSKDDSSEPIDVYDPEVWKKMKWGLASEKNEKELALLLPQIEDPADRSAIAFDHLSKCLLRARQLQQALLVNESSQPTDVAFHLFVGDAVKTSQSAVVNSENGKITIEKYGPGDGKVLAASSRFDKRMGEGWKPFVQSPIQWSSVTYLFAAHMGITKDPVFVDNLLSLLLETTTRTESE